MLRRCGHLLLDRLAQRRRGTVTDSRSLDELCRIISHWPTLRPRNSTPRKHGANEAAATRAYFSSSAFFCCCWISRCCIGLCETGTAGGEDSSRSSAIAAYLLAKAVSSCCFRAFRLGRQLVAAPRFSSKVLGASHEWFLSAQHSGRTAESSNLLQSRDLPRPRAYPSNARFLLSASGQDGITTTGWFLSSPEMP